MMKRTMPDEAIFQAQEPDLESVYPLFYRRNTPMFKRESLRLEDLCLDGEIHDLFPKTSRQHNAAIKTANKLQLLLEKWKTEASASTLPQQSDADTSVQESHS